jgi:hypothetical protein
MFTPKKGIQLNQKNDTACILTLQFEYNELYFYIKRKLIEIFNIIYINFNLLCF